MISIFFEDSFDSAHWLPYVPVDHKCRQIHGHTYKIRIEVTGDLDPHLGWIIDYSDLKARWLKVKNIIDHRTLNSIGGLSNPTCEILAGWIAQQLDLDCLSMIELRETAACGVVYLP